MQASPGIQLALGRAGQGAADVPSSDSESEAGDGPQEEVYEVEEVRASRWDDTTSDWRYLVKWKGYGEDEKTWEPVENLENCRDLVLEFERMKKEREERRQKQAQTAPPSWPAPVLNETAVASSSSDESSSGEGVGLKKFEKRRQEAKKKARKSGGNKPTKAGQVEDTVAAKWEKKAEKKATKTAKKPAKDSPSKGKKAAAAKAPSKTTTRSPAKQRSKAEPASAATPSTSASASKKRAGEVQEPQASTSAVKKQKRAPAISSSSESESDDSSAAKTASRSAPAPRASSSAAPMPATSAAPTSTPSADKTAAAPAPTPVAHEASTSAASKSDSNPPPSPPPRAPLAPSAAQLAFRKAAAAAAQRPAPSPKPAAPAPRSYSPAVPSPAAASPVLPASAASPGPSTAAASGAQPAPPAPAVNRDSLKSISFKKRAPSPGPSNGAASPAPQQNGVRFEEPPAATPSANGASPAPAQQAQAPPPAPGADTAGSNGAESSAVAVNALSPEAQAAKARRMREQLAGHEERLRKTYWYQTQQVFSSDLALPLACAHALNIDPHMIMRMKNRGVAVLFDMNQGEAVKGEGHALGYALLAVGAETPNEMSKVQAVCMHRSYSVDQIEGLYCELTQLKTHTVEFFHFGGGLPLQPVCATGFLIIPLRSALQLVKSVERFSYHARAKYEPMVTIAAHPATLCLIRNTQPNWAAPLALVEEYMSIVDRASIRLGTTYTNISKEAIYSPAASYLPKLDEDQELLEIVEYMSWVRVARPADYRRFIVVSNEVLPVPQAGLRERGMELHTWQSATELIEENFFG